MYFAYKKLGPVAELIENVNKENPDGQTGLHVPHEELGWIVNRNSSSSHKVAGNFDVTYTTDAEGFRTTPHRPQAQNKIYFFGDSFTFGHGVEDDETFASVIALVWLDVRIKTINVGVNGYGLTQMYQRFLDIEKQLRAGDLVVFSPISKDLLRSYKDFAVPAQYLFTHQNKRMAYYPYFENGEIKKGKLDTLSNRIKGLLFHAPLTGKVSRKIHRAYLGPVDFNDAKEMFSLIREKSLLKGAKFQLYFLPQVKDLVRGRYKYDVSMYNYAHIWDYFPAGEVANEKIGFPDDGHWNCHGHEIAAYAIVKTLIEDDLLNKNYLRRSLDTMPAQCMLKN